MVAITRTQNAMTLFLDSVSYDWEGLKMKFKMIIAAILVFRFLVKIWIPANTSISTMTTTVAR